MLVHGTTVGVVGVPNEGKSRAVNRLLLAAAIAALATLVPSGASAEGSNSLRSIDPANGATLAASPRVITLAFDQEIASDEVLTLQLACSFQPQPTKLPEVDSDGLLVTVEIDTVLPRGACNISWTLKDALGVTIVAATSAFSVTSDAPVTATTDPNIRIPVTPTGSDSATASSPQGGAGGAIWLGRLFSTLGILVLFGALALIAFGWPEGPEYAVTAKFLRAVWLVGLVGTVLYLVAYSSHVSGSSFGAALNPASWFDLLDDGWSGRGALLRFVAVGAAGWVALRPERIIDPTTAMWAWLATGMAVVSIALTRTDGPWALLGFVVGVGHMASVAIWIGGVALVARVVLAGPGDEDLVQATRTFSRISVPAIAGAAITGIIQVVRLVGYGFVSTGHGRVLMLKVIVVAVMVFVALVVRQQTQVRLERARQLTAPTADRFRRAFGAEAVLGVVVLAFSGWMLALTPARVDPLAGETYTREITFADAASGVNAKVFIGPSAVGLNGLKIEVSAPADGILSLVFRFTPPQGSTARIIEQPIRGLTTSGTAVLDDSVGIPFDVAGVWTIELVASTTIGEQTGAATTFLVDSSDGSTVTAPISGTSVPISIQIIDQVTTLAPFGTSPDAVPAAP